MYALTLCDFRVEYRLKLVTPLHVGGEAQPAVVARRGQGNGKERGGEDYRVTLHTSGAEEGGLASVILPVHEHDEDSGQLRLFVPSTSLRGAMRHLLWRRLDRALPEISIAPAYERDTPIGVRQNADTRLYGDPSQSIYWIPRFGNILIRHLFGSEARCGALAFSRAQIPEDCRPAKPVTCYSDGKELIPGAIRPDADLRVLTHNRLDRFTMASTEGLRNLAAIEAGTVFAGHITLSNFAWWQVGALALAFQSINDGDLRLGTRGAVGLGQASIEPTRIAVRWHQLVAPPADGPFPGVGRCLEAKRLPCLAPGLDGDELRRRILGSSDPEIQMFLRDADDELGDVPPLHPIPTAGNLGFARDFEWSSGDVCQQVLSGSTRRLAAVARGLNRKQGFADA